MRLNEKNTLSDKGRLEYAEKQYLSPLYRKTFGPLSQLATVLFQFPQHFRRLAPQRS